MKKIISLILSFTLIIGCIAGISVYAETPATDIETDEVITLLKYLNIITDAENLGDNVTRADFAVYAAAMMKLNTDIGTEYFCDVEAGSKAAGAINALADYGYVTGGSGCSYMPYNNVRTTEALKVFLTMLGYKEICEAQGGYPAGYIKIANRLGLNKGIGSEYLSRGQLYALIYRTLVESFCVPATVGQDGSMSFEKDEENNILSTYHDLYIIEGVVNTVGSIAVDMEQPLDEGQFRIGNKIIRTDLISIDMYEYLSTNVKVYYFEEDGIKATAAIVIPYSEGNDVLSVRKDDVAQIEDGGRGYIFRYFDEDDKEKKVEISRGSVIIKNGETVLTDVYKELQIDKGSYKFIDTDGDSKYDVLFVYEYYNIVVGNIEDKMGMVYIKTTSVSDVTDWVFYRGRVGSRRAVYDKYTNDLYINLTEDGSKIIKYKDASGNAIDLADITKDEVISIYKSKSGNYIEVHKGKDSVKGEITEISTTTDDGETSYEIVVGDKAYKVDKSVEDNASKKLSVGLSATFYLDCFGEVGNYVPDSPADVKFGYLVAVARDTNGLSSGDTQVRLFSQDGVLDDYVCSDRIKIDGKTCKEQEDAYNALSAYVKKPVRFSADDDNNLTFVDTIYYDAKLEGSISIYETLEEGTYTKGSNISSFNDTVVYKTSTPVFYVPEDDVIDNNQYLEEHFYTKKFSNLVNDSSINKLSSYRVDHEGIFDDLIIIKQGNVVKGWTQQNVYLVEKITNTLNKDGDAVQCVYAYLNGDLQKFNCKSDCEDLTTKINKGDLVWFDVTETNEIKSLEDIVVDVSGGEPKFNKFTTLTGGENVWAVTKKTDSSTVISTNGKWAGSTLGSYFSVVCGYAGKTRDGALCFAYDKDDALNGDYDFVKNIGSINILVFDKEQGNDGSIYKSGIDDIITVENSYEDCSMVLMMMRNKNLKTVYVYK